MDDLQYYNRWDIWSYVYKKSFKPCYKWMTFNTLALDSKHDGAGAMSF